MRAFAPTQYNDEDGLPPATSGALRAMKRFLLPAIQGLVTLGLLAWIFSQEQLRSEAARLWRLADVRWVLAGLAVGAVHEVFMILRWWSCARLSGLPLTIRRAAALHFIGLFTTLFLPGSAGGDAVKIACLWPETRGRRMDPVLAVLMDRLCGFVAMGGIVFAMAAARYDFFHRTPVAAAIFHAVVLPLGFCLTGLGIWALLSRPGGRRLLPSWMPAQDKLVKLASIFGLFRAGRWLSAAALLLSVGGLFSYFTIFYCAGRALGSDVRLLDLYSVMPLVDLIAMLPITIAGLGLRERSLEALLGSLCGTPSAEAVLMSLGGFGLYAAWSLLGGPVLMLYRPVKAATENAS